MMKYLLAALLAAPAMADSHIYVGGVSYHFNEDLNNFNPSFIYNKNDYFAGYVYNSFKNHTAIAGKMFRLERDDLPFSVGIAPSLVWGYQSGEIVGACSGKVCATALPFVEIEYGEYTPTILFGGTFVTLMLKYDF